MRHTGVKCDEQELDELAELAKAAQTTPVILVGGIDLSANAWECAKKRCHELALKHGLPEITGYYGATADGEFVEV